MRVRCAACCLLAAALLCACAAQKTSASAAQTPEAQASEAQPSETQAPEAQTPENDDAVEALLAEMSVREKVGQLFFVRPDSLDFTLSQSEIDDPAADGVKTVTDALRQALRDYPVGGVVLFGKNVADPTQLAAFTAELQTTGTLPLLIGIDEEGGTVARLANHEGFSLPRYESAAAVGAQGTAAVEEMSRTIADYLRPYGILLDFAPVADVNSNPQNPIIGTRAFSDDPEQAAALVAAAVEGFHAGGVACTLKHFPGHGDTAEDTHLGTATTERTWEEMRAAELLPFSAGIAAGADLVMAAHISTPNASGDGLPASLSYTMLTERLRGELGFAGVIVTDSLAMGAIADTYTGPQACRLAFSAGADALLMPTDFADSFDAMAAAAESGEISEERLNESVRRILEVKQKYGLL